MKIRVVNYTYGPTQIEKCMTALAAVTQMPVYLKATGKCWLAIIGSEPIANAADGPWRALCGAVNQYVGVAECGIRVEQ